MNTFIKKNFFVYFHNFYLQLIKNMILEEKIFNTFKYFFKKDKLIIFSKFIKYTNIQKHSGLNQLKFFLFF